MPSAPSESLPLGEHRARVVEYLRGIALPFRSVAGTIIEERGLAEVDRLMLRPNLVLWACRACGGDADAIGDALPVAAAFDLFDRFMLLHDKLVEEDEATALAGERSACSVVVRWGLGQSLNAGDALYAMALRVLAQDVGDPERRLRVASLVTRAVLEAIEGRTSDTERGPNGRESSGLLARVRSVRRRSAALTGAALEAGALIANAEAGVCRGFRRAGRLLAAAVNSRDPGLAARLSGKAVASIERSIPELADLEGFENLARHVATRAA